MMVRCQKDTYGAGLDERYLHPYMWAWKPHYYSGQRSFYNFPYAFGLLFATGLYAIYRERGKSGDGQMVSDRLRLYSMMNHAVTIQ